MSLRDLGFNSLCSPDGLSLAEWPPPEHLAYDSHPNTCSVESSSGTGKRESKLTELVTEQMPAKFWVYFKAPGLSTMPKEGSLLLLCFLPSTHGSLDWETIS